LFSRAVVDHSFVQSAHSLHNVLRASGFADVAIEPDKTHAIGVNRSARVAYRMGTILSRLLGRTVLVPGVIVWARRPVSKPV
jgi:hypothetical protein